MRNCLCGLDYEVNPLICGVKLDDMGRGREVRIVVVDLEKSRVCPFHNESGGLHEPFEQIIRPSDSDGFVILRIVCTGIKSQVWDEIRHVFIIAAISVGIGIGSWLVIIGGVVFHYSLDVVGVVVVTAFCLWDCAHPVVASCLRGINNNIVSLTHSDAENCSVIGYDGNKVHCNDSHGVIVYHKFEVSVDGAINQSDAVRLSFSKGHVETGSKITINVCAVDETIVQSWGAGSLSSGVDLIGCLMGPIIQEKNTHIIIVVRGSGTVDDDSAKDTLPRLKRKVGVIPRVSVLGRFPGVGD